MMQRRHRFIHTTTEELYLYWDKSRAGRPAPNRTEIEPGDIRNILPDTFILEVEPSGRFIWRLAGTRVCALHCRSSLKGLNFLADWSGQERNTLQSLLDAVVHEKAVSVLQFEGQSERERVLSMEMVLLPLNLTNGETRRILGAVAPLDTPYWLGIRPLQNLTISHMRLLWPTDKSSHQAAFSSRSVRSVFKNTPPVLSASIPNARRYRHLTVHDGGKV